MSGSRHSRCKLEELRLLRKEFRGEKYEQLFDLWKARGDLFAEDLTARGVTFESFGPLLDGRHRVHRCALGHLPDDFCQNLGGLVVVTVQGDTHKGFALTEALKQHRALHVVVDSKTPAFERVQYFPGAPFVSAIPDDLQYDRLAIASAEREDRALGFRQASVRSSTRLVSSLKVCESIATNSLTPNG